MTIDPEKIMKAARVTLGVLALIGYVATFIYSHNVGDDNDRYER